MLRVSSPLMAGNEKKYADDCIDTNFLSWNGKYVRLFEEAIGKATNTKHVVVCTSGTTALHLALKGLGIGPGSEVIVPSMTYVSCANAVRYCGGMPVFADVDIDTWCITPETVEPLLNDATVAIMPVHLYGNICDVERIAIHVSQLFILEDASQAFGSVRAVSSLSDAAVFSFYANKIITTGEGGAVVTNHPDLSAKMRLYRGQCEDPKRRYWHTDVGYNYRMSNMQAALGLAQVEQVATFKTLREKVWRQYQSRLSGYSHIALQQDTPDRAHWVFSAVFDSPVIKDRVAKKLEENEIETRPLFPPLNRQVLYTPNEECPVAWHLYERGLNLPTHAGMTTSEVDKVCDVVLEATR